MGFAAGAGIINCDLLYSQVERLPLEGEEVYSGGFDIQLGGGAPAIMVNLSRLHVPVHFQTFLGKDLFSMHIRGILEEMGMEYRNLYRGEGMPLNITSVAITPEDRTFLTYAGPVELTKREKEEIYRCSSGAKVVKMFMAGGDPEMADIYRQLKREGSILTMDTGWEDGLSLESYREFLELADYYWAERAVSADLIRQQRADINKALSEKMQELFILLRAYYNREELATFFYPLIGKNRDFKDFVYEHYLKVDSLNEFAALANTSVDTFKRRFKETFGEPAHKWITGRKAEHVYRDIALGILSFADIAEKYRFSSVSYLTTFCKQHLGKTPQQLRNEGK